MKHKYYYKDGSILDYLNDSKLLHREDGPAVVNYNRNGEVYHEIYYLEDKRHRVDGPAVVSYNESGKVAYEEYWLEGKRHREDGPASVRYFENGEGYYREYYREYYLEGKEYSKEDYHKILEEVNNMDEAIRLTDPRKWVRG